MEGMMSNFNDVGEFHSKFDLPRVASYCGPCQRYHPWEGEKPGPSDASDDLLVFRAKFLAEELKEFRLGVLSGNIAEMADALVDLVYVAMGTAHLLGLPWEDLWDDVQAANMRKVRAKPDGSDSKRGSSWDVVKPEGWLPPDTWAVLERHGWERPSVKINPPEGWEFLGYTDGGSPMYGPQSRPGIVEPDDSRPDDN
jgi:hypothetical protein